MSWYSVVFKRTNTGVRLPEFESQHRMLFADGPWSIYLIALFLDFLNFHLSIIVRVPTA